MRQQAIAASLVAHANYNEDKCRFMQFGKLTGRVCGKRCQFDLVAAQRAWGYLKGTSECLMMLNLQG